MAATIARKLEFELSTSKPQPVLQLPRPPCGEQRAAMRLTRTWSKRERTQAKSERVFSTNVLAGKCPASQR